MSKVETSNTITLRGSTDIVTEFFNYSVNSILYQRGIYAPESFKRVSKYGLAMMMTTDESLTTYLNNIIKQLDNWLMNGSVQKLVLVIKGLDSHETLERWVFDCDCSATKENNRLVSNKAEKEITQEIQAIIRQITASVTFLPLLSESCSFDLLVYADHEATVPVSWEDSDPCYISNSEDVKLRSFSTQVSLSFKTVYHLLISFQYCRYTKSICRYHSKLTRKLFEIILLLNMICNHVNNVILKVQNLSIKIIPRTTTNLTIRCFENY